jgi:predicted nucleic acid-binding protein
VTFLVDANVLSEATKPRPEPRVLDWMRRHEREIVVDPIILGEIQYGILLLSHGKKRQRLEGWFKEGIAKIACLPWETVTASHWAKLLVRLRRAGQSMPIKDSMIAATALTHGLIMATRNQADFQKAKVPLVNPYE